MSNTIREGDIVINYEWVCPSCNYYSVGSNRCDAQPKEGSTIYCDECGEACEITK